MPLRATLSLNFIRGTPVEVVANVTMAEGTLNHREPGIEAIAARIATWFSNKTYSNSNTYGREEGEERDEKVVIGGWKMVAPLSL
ncbi:hypothetical protein PVK06_030379 [Gossypium arboreum]|uniref:Uncharacterized protein n=1 Tax=Gossypium arboreum TaxID=29729 RepID=A0ABR0NNP6_GOSAR|nr:hypothetical protein PVK06_030379 [Gossypium arboreum]